MAIAFPAQDRQRPIPIALLRVPDCTLLITDPVEFDWDAGTQRIHRDAVATRRA
jgi:hypothetical protein